MCVRRPLEFGERNHFEIVFCRSNMASRPTLAQIESLVDFLEQNPGVAKGLLRTNQARMETKRKWASLALTLNSLGGAHKDGQGWAKYWAEKKCALKKACSQHRESMRRTGGGPADNLPMSGLDRRLVAVMGGYEFAVGDSQLAVDPFPQLSQQVQMPPSPSLAPPAAEEIQIEPVEEHEMVILRSTSPVAGPSRDALMPTPPPHTISGSQPRSSSIPRPRRRRSIPARSIDGDMDRLAQIEERRVAAEAVTAQALAEMAQSLDRYAVAAENIAAGVTQVATALSEGLTAMANAILASARMRQQ